MNQTKKAATKASSARTAKGHDWMTPIEPAAPCGVDLEYDPEFVVLSAKVAPRPDAQYGDFVGSPEPVSWSDAERDCLRLMMRSKDMRVAVLFTRCRTRLAGAVGLAEGIGLLAGWLTAFPDTLHPRPDVDADHEAALEIRMNALQALTDGDGLLADVREIALTRSSAARLQVRDVERAFAQPRPGDALAPESVARQLDEIQAQQRAALAGFDDALAGVTAIELWSFEHLGAFTPDLRPLANLLRHVAGRRERAEAGSPEAAPAEPDAHGVPARPPVAGPSEVAAPAGAAPTHAAPAVVAAAWPHPASDGPADRLAARDLIRAARLWFEQHEPSSPIPVLLRRAEHYVGKGYAEVVRAIPAELLAQWSNDES
ncbi:type VI secretion system ImpA family N-terminal domain-containing protein [Burkholderia sp. FERM BP-3421]|uniref:type VI secretion system protein TssA n=1 Tax=Burkholderia sp. FERM BP-3421 TaxID=1494466 RepID=UPI002360473D|nr:type VI secretion system ImpA family N-terminal domain-containing protein [Burkholderia sp. FERM BP-3421]WDD91931.1 type VI secretion system ImpA family N-terminal domain-containing protein [Burkholderia sp. FERM BP-3421]